jgi:hypothetical protein
MDKLAEAIVHMLKRCCVLESNISENEGLLDEWMLSSILAVDYGRRLWAWI